MVEVGGAASDHAHHLAVLVKDISDQQVAVAVGLVKHPDAVTVVIVLDCAGGCGLACPAAVGIVFVGGNGISAFFDLGQPVVGVVKISACAVTGHVAVVVIGEAAVAGDA